MSTTSLPHPLRQTALLAQAVPAHGMRPLLPSFPKSEATGGGGLSVLPQLQAEVSEGMDTGYCPVPASNIPMVIELEWEPPEGGTCQGHSHSMTLLCMNVYYKD